MSKLFITALCCGAYFGALCQAPTADFSINTNEACLGVPINFSDASVQGSSIITDWNWDFGDGNSSSEENPTHEYAQAGAYTVTLVVTSENGQSDAEVKSNLVIINPLPTAEFTALGDGCSIPFNVSFTNSSSQGVDINYDWDFGNGESSNLENPASTAYSVSGNYNVILTVTNSSSGCSNVSSQEIVVSDYSTGMSVPSEACVGEMVSLTDNSTVGTNVWNWSYGDGFGAQMQNATHAYTEPGVYTVTLTSQNTNSGCTDSNSQSITIHDLPSPSFTSDISVGCAPLSVDFSNTSSFEGDFQWDFGNGSAFSGENPPSQTFLEDGEYTIKLTVTDLNGCVGSTTASNMISVSAPVAQFSTNVINGCEPLMVDFSDASTAIDPIDDPIVSWSWDFGDGSAAFNGEIPPSHEFLEGIYDVSLTVSTQNGCQATVEMSNAIKVGSIESVNFSIDPTTECAKTEIDFLDLTLFDGTPNEGEVNYAWNFGDGATSSQQNPSHAYVSDTGYFDVSLMVNWRGCTDTLTQSEAVYILAPISNFTTDQTLFCNPSSLPVDLNVADLSIHGSIPDDVEMIWNWGDGSSTSLDNAQLDDADKGSASHSFQAYGSYAVEQVIYNHTTGCSDSTTQTIHVSQVVADFTLSNDSVCVNSPLTMTSTSTSSHPFGTFSYDMGNEGVTSGNPALYTYNNSGIYDIQLIAINNVGCADTTGFQEVDVLELPIAEVIPDLTVGCAPITVNYTNNSTNTGNGVALDYFNWTFPDLSIEQTSSIGTSTSFVFESEGVFQTSLIAVDEFGCVSLPAAASMTITKPNASFNVDAVVCNLEEFTTANTGTGGVSHEWYVDGQSVSDANSYTGMFDETGSSQSSVAHNIMLISTDVNGCLDTSVQEMVVSLPQPVAEFDLTGSSVDVNGQFKCPPVFAEFIDMTESYGNIVNWSWAFGDGKLSTLKNPQNTYVFPGSYTASLTVTDEFGCTEDTILTDFLSIGGPVGFPDWTAGTDICGQKYTFTVTGTSNVQDIVWNFGDGNSENSVSGLSYTYSDYDTYSPTATLIDSLNCEVVHFLSEIQIESNGLEAFFSASPDEGPIGTEFFFDEASVFSEAPIELWSWSMDGMEVIHETNMDMTMDFGLPGTYPVVLTIIDTNGCTDEFALSVTVKDEFHLPNVITPNGDGVNELFSLPAPIFESYDIVIVNRWGNLIHSENDASGTSLWNGKTKNGKEVTEGVYFYKLIGKLTNGKQAERQGNITVAY